LPRRPISYVAAGEAAAAAKNATAAIAIAFFIR
jgi:hypothetical protein